jgi:hypothetical protein
MATSKALGEASPISYNGDPNFPRQGVAYQFQWRPARPEESCCLSISMATFWACQEAWHQARVVMEGSSIPWQCGPTRGQESHHLSWGLDIILKVPVKSMASLPLNRESPIISMATSWACKEACSYPNGTQPGSSPWH